MKRIALTAFALSTLAFTSSAFPALNPLSWTGLPLAQIFSNSGDNKRKEKPQPTNAAASTEAISITTLGTPITQNFDSLATSGTGIAWADDTTLQGWYSQFELNSSAPTSYRAVTGSITTAGLRSLGINGAGLAADRAFGSLPNDVGADTTIGTVFNALKLVNSAGSAIASLDVSFVGEQWRAAGCTGASCVVVAQKLDFQYQVANSGTITDANTPSTGWLDFNGLDFVSPIIGNSGATSLDGNLAANRTGKSGTLSVTVNPGQEVWIRWVDVNDSNLDHALAIDDVSVTPQGVVVNNCDYCNLQFPSTFTVAGGQTSPIIYGRIFDAGITEAAGGSASVTAQVGYGPDGSDPRTSSAWTYSPAAFNTQVGNDDEYAGTITVPASATTTQYRYTYRFSLDGGANWSYADLNGAGTNSGLSFDPAQLGVMTVTPGSAPPMINTAVPATATEDTVYSYNAAATDPDGLGLTWSLVSPTHTCGGSIDVGTGVFTFTPAGPVPSASCVVAIRVTDALAPAQSATQTATVTIGAVNDTPLIISGAPTDATENVLYTYNAAVDDPDGPAASWTLNTPTHTCGGSVDEASGIFTFTPRGSTPPPSCVVSIKVTDGGSPTLSAIETTTVTITDTPSATLVVDNLTDDPLLKQCTSAVGDCSLRGAIDLGDDGDTIVFDGALTAPLAAESAQTIILNDELTIFEELNIDGPGAALLTISGNNASRVLNISSGALVSIEGVTISDGALTSGGGAGIWNSGATLTLTNVVVSNNTTTGAGGGIFCSGSGSMSIIGSTISGNSVSVSGNGGGIQNNCTGAVVIVLSTVSGNSAASMGGGIRTTLGSLTLIHSTITNNSATNDAGGISQSGGTLTIANSIVAGNINNSSVPDIAGAFDSDGFNLIGNLGTATGFGQAGDQAGDGAAPLDPKLGPLQNNAGPVPTHALLTSPDVSPAFDKGNSFGYLTDGRGLVRTVDFSPFTNAAAGDGTDIGAYEFQAVSAAPASISGYVRTASGAGIRNARITIEGANLAEPRSVKTGARGYFKINGLSAGQGYILSVNAKRYTFAEPARIVSLSENISDMDFTALP